MVGSKGRCGALLLGAAAAVMMAAQTGFLEASSRRSMLAAGAAGLLGAPLAAHSMTMSFPGLDEPYLGTFEMDVKDAKLDPTKNKNDAKVQEAVGNVTRFRDEAQKALDSLSANGQADISFFKGVTPKGLNRIAEIRIATNKILYMFDDRTQAAIERMQRLMIDDKDWFDEDYEMPTNKKGEVFERGAGRTDRLKTVLTSYVKFSNDILLFLDKAQVPK